MVWSLHLWLDHVLVLAVLVDDLPNAQLAVESHQLAGAHRTGGMLIQFRSYLNHHFPNDNPTVLRVAYSEIEWARAHRLHRSTPGFTRGDDWNQRLRYFEFRFRDGAHTEELHDKLVEERQRQGPRQPKWYG